jgi:hypothetical protein
VNDVAKISQFSECRVVLQSMTKIPNLVNPKAAARILARPESTLRYWRCAGTGPRWIKLEGRVLYDTEDLVEYIDRGRRTPSVRAYMEEHDVSL